MVLVVLLLVGAPSAHAKERIEDLGEVPYYARVLPGEAWSVIVFYRPPSCVPPEFDLYSTFFDVPQVFDCDPPTTGGFAIFDNDAPVPSQLKLHGLGTVPIWFVQTSELAAVAADDAITLGELETLPSLMVGTASSYQEVLHPLGGAQVPKIMVVARGTLEDGRFFQVQVSQVNQHYDVHVKFK
jgi:hypothetical protein